MIKLQSDEYNDSDIWKDMKELDEERKANEIEWNKTDWGSTR